MLLVRWVNLYLLKFGVLCDPWKGILLLCMRAAKHIEQALANSLICNSDRGRGSTYVVREPSHRGESHLSFSCGFFRLHLQYLAWGD